MSASPPLVVVGAGGHAKVCVEVLRADGRFEAVACVDPAATGEVLGVPVVGGDEALPGLLRQGVAFAMLAVGDNALRERLGRDLLRQGFHLPPVIHPRAWMSPTARIGAGVVVMAGAVVNAEADLGDFAVINSGAVVEHDCRVGSGAHVGPGTVLAGGVTVGARAFLGAGSVAKPAVTIGDDAAVGCGAAVVSDLAGGAIYAGVPARRLADP